MAVTSLSLVAATNVSAHLAFVGDKNCHKFASNSCSLPSKAALLETKVGFRNHGGLGLQKKGWIAARSSKKSSDGRRMSSICGKFSVRAEIYIEEADGKTTVEIDGVTIPNAQNAWLYQDYGAKEVLSIAEIPVGRPAPDQVLVKVHAAALNPVDFKRRLGKFKNSDSDLPTVPGYDVAGEVVLAGSKVTKFKVGDRVYGDVSEHALNSPKQYGSLAEYCAVEEKLIAPIPQNLSFTEAASLPLAVETAYETLEAAGLKEGETVLVLGGAGGVGSLAVQLAKHVFKASVVAATTSTPKVEFMKGLGADIVIDYKVENLAEHPTKYDVVLDTVGKGEALLGLAENGRAVVLTGPVEPPAFRFVVISRGDVLEKLSPFLEDGTVKPIVDTQGPYKFSELREAFGYLEEGRATGKVVVTVVQEE